MRILYQIPDFLQHLYKGVVWRLNPSSKVIYLTFDDGCIPQVTPQVLNILQEKNVKATFFLVADNVRKYPHLLKLILSQGHQVGNHTFHHLKGLKTSTNDYMADVMAADKLIKEGGAETNLFRPPYGRITFKQKHLLQQNHKIVLWDLLTHDYNPKYTPGKILRIIKKYSRNGSVVVFHDSIKAAPNMLQVLPQAIDFWLEQGYQLKTL